MVTKKKTSTETQVERLAVGRNARAATKAVTEPGDDVPRPRRKVTTKPAAKPAAKPSAKTAAKPAAKTAAKSAAKTAAKSAAKPAAKTAAESAPKRRSVTSTRKRAAAAEAEPQVAASIADAAGPEIPPVAEAEIAAQAADTFEEAFEAKGLTETSSPAAAAGMVTPAAAVDEQKAPNEAPEGWTDEGDEMEGDWESGSGDEQKSTEERPEPPPARQERLQKILAAAGVASRRHAEQLIVEGRVQVNGSVVTTLGSKADPARDHIRVDGKLIHGAERHRYLMLNKPRGYVTTVSDPEGRPTVMQFLTQMGERLYPVGRLDFQSEGLLLMTNDGELANKLTRAASGVEKIYVVKVAGQPDEKQIEALRSGVQIDRARQGEGKVQTAPALVRQIRQGDNPWFEVGLIEGRNRELRKMFEEIGHHVEKIRRVGYGPLELDVEPGKMRELTPDEVQALRLAAEGKLKPRRVRASAMLPREAGRKVDYEAAGQRGGRGSRNWQDRRTQGEERPGGNQQRGQRNYPDRDRRKSFEDTRGGEQRRHGKEDRGAFAPRGENKPAFGGRGGRAVAGGVSGRGFDRDRPQRTETARPQGQRPLGAKTGSGERGFRGKPGPNREKPRFEERPRREGFEERSSRPGPSGFRPQRGSGPKPGGFRPEGTRFRPEGGDNQRRGQRGSFGQRFTRPEAGQRGPSSPRTAQSPRSGPGPRGTGSGQRAGGEANRSGFGRKSSPPKFRGGGRFGGHKGRRP